MASNTQKTRSRVDQLKADLLSVSTCSNATITILQELLLGNPQDSSEKENSRAKAPAPVRKRGTAQNTVASGNAAKKGSIALAPKEKYILATEVANITLQTLSDALKQSATAAATRPSLNRHDSNTEDARKASQARSARTNADASKDTHKALKERSAAQVSNSPQKRQLGRASSNPASPTPGVDAGVLAVAECARLAFAYMGTSEATKVVGKDKTDLQYENGLLVLAGKLIALGMDNMAVKELRTLKRRLEAFLGHGAAKKTTTRGEANDGSQPTEKETIASLLAFDSFALDSPALPLVINLQTYVLRIIAKYKKPRVVETAWEHLQTSKPSSAANLITHFATHGSGQAKTARQLESLAQTLLSLCPSISSTSDASTSQPSAEIVLRLQQLAFKLRKQWWSLVQHKGNQEQELFEPFAKCINAFARRSQLAPTEKYNVAKSLYVELSDSVNDTQSNKREKGQYTSAACKILCSLAQAAGLSDEVLQWLGSTPSATTSPASGAKDTARLLRIANVSIDKVLKGDKADIENAIHTALDALNGTMEGLASDLESLFMEVNALRRTATRLFVLCLSKSSGSAKHSPNDGLAVQVIAASVRFSVRFVGVQSTTENDSPSQLRHVERIRVAWTSVKSIVDSTLTCCKQDLANEEQWKELDNMLQELAHLLRRLEEEIHDGEAEEKGSESQLQKRELVSSCMIKMSNAYWAVYMQLKKSCPDSDSRIIAMRRSIDLAQSRSEAEKEAAHYLMKLEQLAYTLEGMKHTEASHKAYAQCVQSVLLGGTAHTLTELAGTKPPEQIFTPDGPLRDVTRFLRAFHSSVLKHGLGSSSTQAFYDDEALEAGGRGAILEWQLSLFSRTLSRNRRWDHSLNTSLNELTRRLQSIYQADVYPIRYMRFSIQLSDLINQHPNIFPQDGLQRDLAALVTSIRVTQDCADIGLAPYKDHLTALLDLKLLLRQSSATKSRFENCFTVWESIVRSASSWETLAGRVDDVQDLLQSIDASVDYLNAKGEEYLALPVLHLLVKLYELQGDSDASNLVSSLSMLGLQYLRLGYTGQSGLHLAKAEGFIQRQTTSTEVKLRWHIAYTEYLVGIGNVSKATTILSRAQTIAVADPEFMDLAKPSTTLSNRVRFNRLLADASYVHSLLAISVGSYKEAARHARQSVAVNRRTWAAVESKMKEKRAATHEAGSSPNDLPFDPLSSMRNDRGMPVIASVTHEALDGPEMWSLVPSLYRALMQHSQVFAQQGLLHEAIYVAEQAEKVALSTKSPTLMTDNGSWRADCWAQSDRVDKAQRILDSLSGYSTRHCLSTVGYHSAVARKHHWNSYFDEEVDSYNTLEDLLGKLKSPAYIRSLQSFSTSVDALADTISTITLNDSNKQPAKASTRARKPAARTASRAAPTARAKAGTATKSVVKPSQKVTASKMIDAAPISDECATLVGFQANILDRKAVAYLLQDELDQALNTLRLSEELHHGAYRGIQHMWATFKAKFAQGIQQIAADINVNTLPESTIAFPAVGLKERRLSEALAAKSAALSASASGSKGRPKKQTKEDYTATIREARELLVEAHALSSLNRSTQLFTQISLALGQVTVLLSAFSGQETLGFLHPLYAAYMNEIPRCNALKLAQESVEGEKESLSRDELLQWPMLKAASAALVPVTSFQQEYVDILPECYTAVSMALNETCDELYITRYEHGTSPFVLRLPLARQASRDMDEEEFSFEDGKKDFDEIIELSDFSTKTAKDMTSKEARLQWWAEREALDNRLHELLINIENIWLGGFKGIFSQQERRPALLARFRKTLENILNQHLPSRQKKTTTKRPQLDSRVLELFVGLGDACDESIDMDDALMDLIYFVVDILQYNGERNAYDEIDFDAMVVEVQDALRAYHHAISKAIASRHTILILDKNLHPFPWESMPCLEQLSISRLPSLAALQERLVSARPSLREPNATPGHYIQVESGGTSILNPSKDLSHTLKTIGPRLQELQGTWDFIDSRAPTEKEFEDSLRAKDLVLYFGHGSGAQYIKSKSVRRLYEPENDESDSKPGCATTLLFGCSSVHLTENGVYEPSGMLASYLTAGAPAVVGMLWDVTDKDCDRLAIRAGELWGLWPEGKEDIVPPKTPAKTPGKSAKGKGRVAQLVSEVEGPRDAPKKKNGKKLLVKNEEIDLEAKSCKGVGLDQAVKDARKACVLRYLNGAAAVVYGIPVFLE